MSNKLQQDLNTRLLAELVQETPSLTTVKVLLEEGACANTISKHQENLLMISSKIGRTDIAQTLIDKGAKVNFTNGDGWTSLMFAAQSGHIDTMKTLIAHDAHVDAQTRHGSTALIIATINDKTGAVRVLLNEGAKDLEDKEHRTAFNIASATHNLAILNILPKPQPMSDRHQALPKEEFAPA